MGYLIVALLLGFPPPEDLDSLRVPDGFVVREFAGSELADDIYCMTLDGSGRVMVAGRGYLRILSDDDGDGRADRAQPFSDEPAEGAMGLLWEGDSLLFTGGGGIRRLRDADGDGRADGPSELLVAIKTGGEHDAHALRRGPDGWLYLITGNQAGVGRTFATTARSPIAEPVAGCLLRFSRDFGQSEIVADGFRNPYDFDFSTTGEPFVFDSDNERCVSLPWYEPTRFYRVRPGGHHGWLNPQYAEWWRLPPDLFDVEAPVATLGRGSPTGVACYRHAAFPAEYRGGFFLADWTFGRIHFVGRSDDPDRPAAPPRVFLEATGAAGFAPTDLAVEPASGDLYVSIGGRGTRGAVYRIHFEAAPAQPDAMAVAALQPRPRDEPDRRPHPSLVLALNEAPQGRPRDLLDAAFRRLDDPAPNDENRLVGVRLAQLALGDIGSPRHRGNVWEGYTPRIDPPTIPPRDRARLLEAVSRVGAGAKGALGRESARTAALLQDERGETLARAVAALTNDSEPVRDIHTLIVVSRLRAPRTPSQTHALARALLGLDRKLDERGAYRDRHWPLRITELHQHLARKDPPLNEALLSDPEFGRPAHVALTHAPGLDRRRAAERILARAEADPDYPWSADLIELIDELPAERSLPVLRSLWGRAGLDEAILPILVRDPATEDRARFLAALRNAEPAPVVLAAEALERLPHDTDTQAETIALLRALIRLGGSGREETGARHRIAEALRRRTGQTNLGDEPAVWSTWLETAHPDWIPESEAPAAPAWRRRLATLDWSAGDSGRGRTVFVRQKCDACHHGARAVGPDLAGVAGRFSREDLFRAIIEPSREVPARYAATMVATRDGQIYQGVVIYEAVDGTIVQTGAASTVRIAGRDIAERRTVQSSPMPTGLLDDLTNQELVDLDAYLRSLAAPRGDR